ncbi:right-handed parallel beta-helix repeat-containing protein [Phycisphaerales bacterium AB-hyl4]|uniref:Right-handed parallel beta-helix repeat-containing protein n=1 Tax=Natronomicrosphaera hydrolytica TaxID=3242702 RepID=A0ABV4U6D0_9BACT
MCPSRVLFTLIAGALLAALPGHAAASPALTATTLSAFQQTGEAASLGMVSFDANAPDTHTQQSGQAINFNVDARAGNQLDVVVIAWSEEQSAVVNAFAHTLTGEPWRIASTQLDNLPLGRSNLQLMLRSNGRVVDRAFHWVDVQPAPQRPASISFNNAPATWQKEVDGEVALNVEGNLPDGADMLVLAWSDEQSSMVDAFAHTLTGEPWRITQSQLNQLPEGRNNIQLLLRLPGQDNVRANHWIDVEAAPAPDPGNGGGIQPGLTVSFNNAPGSYTVGSGQNINLALSGDMPEGGDIMALAWSDEQGGMVDAFAHAIGSGPWQISSTQLDQLPDGRVNLQMRLRVPNAEVQQTSHWINVSRPGNGDDDNGNGGDPGDDDDNGNGGDPGNGDDDNGDGDDNGNGDDNGDDDNGNGDDNGDGPGDLDPPDPNFIDRSSNGWTDFRAPSGARVIYVSNSQGNDNNDGLAENRPVRSLNRAYSLLRNGQPDQMLLRRGDRWSETFPRWEKSGQSRNARMVIGTYGEGNRPIVGHGGGSGNTFVHRGVRRHIAIVGIEFDGRGRNNNLRLIGEFHDLHIEDCYLHGAQDNINAHQFNSGRPSGFTIRRSIIAESRPSGGSHSQGIYLGYMDNITIEDNIFDRNGLGGGARATIFNHNVYTYECNDVTIRNNIFSHASSFGLKLSSNTTGGSRRVLVEDNLFFGSPNGMSAGYSGGAGYGSPHNFQDLTIRRNLFTRIGGAINVGGNPTNQSFAVYVSSINRGQVDQNWFVHKPFEAGHSPIQFYDDKPNRDVMVQRNVIFNWYWNEARHPAIRLGPSVQSRWNEVKLPANRYVDASREVSTYHGWIGRQATMNAFVTEARKQGRNFWRPAYEAKSVIAYIREGYTQLANYD